MYYHESMIEIPTTTGYDNEIHIYTQYIVYIYRDTKQMNILENVLPKRL